MERFEEMENKQGLNKGLIFVIFGASLWGASGACGQFLFQSKHIESAWLVPYRLLFAGCVIIIMQLIRQGKETFKVWKEKRDVVELLIFGLFGMAGCQFSYFFSIQNSNAGTGTVLQSLSTVFIMVTTCILAKRLPRKTEIVALVFAFSGAVLLATKGDFGSLKLSPPALISGIISALLVVVYSMQSQRLIHKFGTLTITGWGMVVGGIIAFFVFKPYQYQVSFDFETIAGVLGIFILGTICAFSLFLEGVKRVGPKTASLIGTLEPFVATVISICVLKSPFTIADIIGFCLIISTVFICVLENNRGK